MNISTGAEDGITYAVWRRFGNAFCSARTFARKSLSETARVLGISPAYLCDVEKGRRGPLSTQRIITAATFFGVDPRELISSSGRVTLESRGLSDTHRRLGAMLCLRWRELSDDQLRGISRVVQQP